YSIFGLAVAAALQQTGAIPRAVAWYGRWSVCFLYWSPVAILVYALYPMTWLTYNDGFSLLTIKAGDIAVHLAGAASFLALGLYRRISASVRPVWSSDWFLWIVFACGFLAAGSRSRGGLLLMSAS